MSRDRRSQSFRTLNMPYTISRSGWFDKVPSGRRRNSIHPAVEVKLYPAVTASGEFKRRTCSCP
jgi:hypothetical protein